MQITLIWDAVEGADYYRVYRAAGPQAASRIANNVEDSTYVDTGLTNGESYSYQVSAVIDVGDCSVCKVEGQKSVRVIAAPAVPVNISVTAFQNFSKNVLTNIDTFVGTGGVSGQRSAHLDAYTRVVPAASRPFGLVRVSTINTRRSNYFYWASWRWNGPGPGYNVPYYFYDHNPDRLNTAMLVQGFAMNSLSGPGCPLKYDFPFMMSPGSDSTTVFAERYKKRLHGSVPHHGRRLQGYEVKTKSGGGYEREGQPGYLKYVFKERDRIQI